MFDVRVDPTRQGGDHVQGFAGVLLSAIVVGGLALTTGMAMAQAAHELGKIELGKY